MLWREQRLKVAAYVSFSSDLDTPTLADLLGTTRIAGAGSEASPWTTLHRATFWRLQSDTLIYSDLCMLSLVDSSSTS